MYENYFTGTVPDSLCLNSQLISFFVETNMLEGSLPSCLGENMTKLVSFFISDNMLTGTFNEALLCETRLGTFAISSNLISGTIPACINNIKESLFNIIASNNLLSGSIPDEICELSHIYDLSLNQNKLTGTIPSCIGGISGLNSFWFYDNQISGSIPTSICDVSGLALFDGFINQMTGTIPSCLLYDLPQMYLLYLDRNNFSGPFFSNDSCALISKKMQYLSINGNNLTGTLPACLNTQFPELISLSVYDNKHITGSIPSGLFNITTLTVFAASNMGLTGTLPTCWKSTSVLKQLFLGQNKLTGTIPHSICLLKKLQYLSLSYNKFDGDIPSCFGSSDWPLVYLNLSDASLTGSLPETLCYLNKTLAYLSADKNELQGSVASCFGSMNVLQRMILSYNQLTGDMRFFRAHHGLPMLEELDIAYNKFTGSLFEDLSAFSSLVRPLISILAENNQFSGPLPLSTMANASNTFGSLQTANIGQNHFYGKLHSALLQAAPLINFAMVKNCLSGTIPDSICDAVTLEVLSLDGLSAGCKRGQHHSKGVYGSIPTCVFAMPAIRTLHLGANNLIGSLPDGAGYYNENFTDLSLSHNQLGGPIPDRIQNRGDWAKLDLAFNKFNEELIESDDKSMWDATDRAVSLNRNRLSGHIPQQLLLAEAINILEGNLFACNIQASNLPQEDPYAARYSCGTNTLNIMLYIGAGLIGLSLIARFAWINSDRWYPAVDQEKMKQEQEQGLSMIDLPNSNQNDDVESFNVQQGDENEDSKSESTSRGVIGGETSPLRSVSIPHHTSSETTAVHRLQVPATSLSGSASTRVNQGRGSSIHNDSPNNSSEDGNSSRRQRHNLSTSEPLTSSRHQGGSCCGSDSNHTARRNGMTAELKDRVRSSVKMILADVGLSPSMSPLSGRSKFACNHISGSYRPASPLPSEFRQQPQGGDCELDQRLQLPSQQSHRSYTDDLDMQLQLGPGKLALFLRSCDQQRRLFLGSVLVSIVIFFPVYIILGSFFRTHSQVYAWVVSVAFTSGVIPAATLLCLWVILLLFLYRVVDPLQRYRGRGSTMRFAWQRLYQMHAFWQEYTLIAVVLLLNACFLLALNGAYVILVLRYGRAVSTALQIILAMFKILYNSRFVSHLVKGSESLQIAAQKMKQQKHEEQRQERAAAAAAQVTASNVEETRAVEEAEYEDDGLIPGISSEAALIVFNFIIVPIIATACVENNCFYSAIVPSPSLRTVFPTKLCAAGYSFDSLINAVRFSACATVIESSITTTLEPPFSYSGQCASSVIAAYVPVFVLMFLVNLLLFPLPRLFGQFFCSKKEPVIEEGAKSPTKLPEVLDGIGFDRRGFTMARVTNFAVLLTFGWVFPPLAILIVMVEVRDVAYVAATIRRHIQQTGDIKAVEKELGWHVRSVAQSVSYLQLRCLPLGAVCLALVLFDMAGDSSGYSRGAWALILMAFMPWLLDQLLLHIGSYTAGNGGGGRKLFGFGRNDDHHPTDAIHAGPQLQMSVPVDIENGSVASAVAVAANTSAHRNPYPARHYYDPEEEHAVTTLYEPIRSDENVVDEDSGDYQDSRLPSTNTAGSGNVGPRLIFGTNEYDMITFE